MNNFYYKIRGVLVLLICTFVVFQSCVKEDFDAPPPYEAPDVPVNGTLEDILKYHRPGSFVTIEDDLIVDAIVIANDSSGNYYKTIVLQDDDLNIRKGLELKINGTNLFNQMQIGRKIYLKCKGLIISDYNGLVQVGASTYQDNSGNMRLGGIEPNLLHQYIVRGKINQDINPNVSTIENLRIDHDQSTLVTIENVQFIASDTSELYTDQLTTTNRTVTDCFGNTIIVRSSNYATFAAEKIPNGKGSITGVFSSFGSDKQLFLRRIEEVDLYKERCKQTVSGTEISIRELRNMYPSLPSDSYVKGTVISDVSKGNIHYQNAIIQDAEGYGIAVRFRDKHNLLLGDEIIVTLDGVDFGEYNGLMQLNNVPLSNMVNNGQVMTIEPKVISIEEILNDFERYESTLVSIKQARITKVDGDAFIYLTKVDDDTEAIAMFTSPGASFANNKIPQKAHDIIAIVSQGGQEEAEQLSLRSLDDISGYDGGGSGSGDCEPKERLDERFNSVMEFSELACWTSYAEGVNTSWAIKSFEDNYFVEFNPFGKELDAVVVWLISPEISSGSYALSYESAVHHWKHDGLSAYYSEDFDVETPSAATWNEITDATFATDPGVQYGEFEKQGPFSIGATGNFRIAFRFEGDSNTNTTAVRFDNIIIE